MLNIDLIKNIKKIIILETEFNHHVVVLYVVCCNNKKNNNKFQHYIDSRELQKLQQQKIDKFFS